MCLFVENDKIYFQGFFKCHNEKMLLDPRKVCDKIIDCLNASDEILCSYPKFKREIQSCKIKMTFSLFCNFTKENYHKNDIENETFFNEEKFKKIETFNGNEKLIKIFKKQRIFVELNILIIKKFQIYQIFIFRILFFSN